MDKALFEYKTTYHGHDRPESVNEKKKLTGCIFMFAEHEDVEDSSSLNKWITIIQDNGGRLGQTLAECTHLVCKTRTTQLYKQAVQEKKRCVTIYWLQDVLLNSKTLHYPWKALHLPLPYTKDEAPCRDHVITVTNFEGKERTQLKEMIASIGAIYTENMTAKNTALICRHSGGQKYKKALQWNLPIVNVTWISDLLLGSSKALALMLVLPKYQSFTSKDPLRLTTYHIVRDIMYPWTTPIQVFPHSLSSKTYNLFGNGENYENFQSNLEKDIHLRSIYTHLHRAHTNEADGYVFTGEEKSASGLRRLDPSEALVEIKNIDSNANLLQL